MTKYLYRKEDGKISNWTKLSILIPLITAFIPLGVSALQSYNAPDKVPESYALSRDLFEMSVKFERLKGRVELLTMRFSNYMDEESNLEMFSMEENYDEIAEETGTALAFAPQPSAPPQTNLDRSFGETDEAASGATITFEDYTLHSEALNENEARLAMLEATLGPVVGWVYLGQWDDLKNTWIETTIDGEYDEKPPEVGDLVTLTKDTFFRDSKPALLTLVKGKKLDPEILYKGTSLEILEVDHNVGLFVTYSWAKVEIIESED